VNGPELYAGPRHWLRYAQEDLRAAETGLGRTSTEPRHACWLAQQAAEKALKAVLVFLGVAVPDSHDLDALRRLVPDGWQRRVGQPGMAELTVWAIEGAYPSDRPEATEADVHTAIAQARAIWESVCAALAQEGVDVQRLS
jgi:HEPN domain-containing protein